MIYTETENLGSTQKQWCVWKLTGLEHIFGVLVALQVL